MSQRSSMERQLQVVQNLWTILRRLAPMAKSSYAMALLMSKKCVMKLRLLPRPLRIQDQLLKQWLALFNSKRMLFANSARPKNWRPSTWTCSNTGLRRLTNSKVIKVLWKKSNPSSRLNSKLSIPIKQTLPCIALHANRATMPMLTEVKCEMRRNRLGHIKFRRPKNRRR